MATEPTKATPFAEVLERAAATLDTKGRQSHAAAIQYGASSGWEGWHRDAAALRALAEREEQVVRLAGTAKECLRLRGHEAYCVTVNNELVDAVDQLSAEDRTPGDMAYRCCCDSPEFRLLSALAALSTGYVPKEEA
jgi:hypothetical protein